MSYICCITWSVWSSSISTTSSTSNSSSTKSPNKLKITSKGFRWQLTSLLKWSLLLSLIMRRFLEASRKIMARKSIIVGFRGILPLATSTACWQLLIFSWKKRFWRTTRTLKMGFLLRISRKKLQKSIYFPFFNCCIKCYVLTSLVKNTAAKMRIAVFLQISSFLQNQQNTVICLNLKNGSKIVIGFAYISLSTNNVQRLQ